MAEQRKLKMAIPDRKWLIHPNRWNVGDILRRAEIGEYDIDGTNVKFSVSNKFPNVEVVVVKPRRIPSEILSGNYDIGITGSDCVSNEDRGNDGSLTELLDLGCGYVDLAFMTDSERWEVVKSKRHELEMATGCKNLNDLDLFLALYGENNNRVICKSELPLLASNYLSSICSQIPSLLHFDFTSEKSIGDTETCLFCTGEDKANIILETYATGEHAKVKNLKVLAIADDSSARLYVRNDPKRSEQNRELIRRIHGRILGAVKEIEELVQVRFVFELTPKTDILNDFSSFLFHDNPSGDKKIICGSNAYVERNPLVTLDRIVAFRDLPSFSGIDPSSGLYKIFRIINFPYKVVDGSKAGVGLIEKTEVTEDKMKTIALNLTESILQNPPKLYRTLSYPTGAPPKSTFEEFMRWFGANLKGITFFRLKSLYAYCPISRESDEGNEESDIKRYPTPDVSKLRPEHRERAIIYLLKL